MADVKKLLIVDDNEDILSTFYDFFNSMGYEVETAVDGFAALKLIKSTSIVFNCLITDLVMPNISGVGLISIIKKEYPDIKVIAMTGYGDQPGALASEAKADIVLFKPVDLFKIENMVSRLINRETDK
ncbi:response regulator [Desulfobacula phenolica]|uniref:Response regulator receiver domain-containing protein n=1 Tax=Desulfobacula phenolica TaxID=90732 RepID=A0A1H2EXD8_9BACT|nr:response regulator [Desulfobacula phenolica]SDT99767.1 Response regulator receiver domain-containing protein [Desulfobacula phenolica]